MVNTTQNSSKITLPYQSCCSLEDESQIDTSLTVFDDEAKGSRLAKYDTYLEIVQEGMSDSVFVHYEGLDLPESLSYSVDAVEKGKIIKMPRGDGAMYQLKVDYSPENNPYLKNNTSLLQRFLTFNHPPINYVIKGPKGNINIKVFNPDVWKLSLNIPSFKKYKVGAKYLSRKQENITVNGAAIVADKKYEGEFQFEEVKGGWKQTTKTSIENKYEEYSGMMVTESSMVLAQHQFIDNSIIEESKRTNLGISISVNGKFLKVDALESFKRIVKFVQDFNRTINQIKDIFPKVGFYIDYQYDFLQGNLDLIWCWKEIDGEHEAFYYVALAANITFFQIQLEFGIGIEVSAVRCQICVSLSGSIQLSSALETYGKVERRNSVGKLQGDIVAGSYCRFDAGSLVNLIGGVETAMNISGEVFIDINTGLEIEGKTHWTGVKVLVQVHSIFGDTDMKPRVLVEPSELKTFVIPEKAEITNQDEISTVYEIQRLVKMYMKKGWFPPQIREIDNSRRFNKQYNIDSDLIAKKIADRIWQDKDKLALDTKTIEGLAQSIRFDCEQLIERKTEDFLWLSDLYSYLLSSTFEKRINEATDPVKVTILAARV